ncbi:MAG: hypothetical protein SFV52_15285 [Saprospiraceae bacterium]|nr:hypothetical protein [Saprospiraceae bacterium]
MNRIILFAFVLLGPSLRLHAQGKLPRLFLDIPAVYLTSPDVTNIDDWAGGGLHAAMNVGTHWGVVRVGGGSDFLFNLQDLDQADEESFMASPYALLEAGAGLYRSNGNKCARTNQNAFTAMGKAGLRYRFNEDAVIVDEVGEEPEQLEFVVGAEFGYFYLSDVFRNWEFFVDGLYYTNSGAIQVSLGTKFFLNLRSNR